jgi:hypothetical protein
VRWRGVDIWIIPVTMDSFGAVALRVPPGWSRSGCEELVLRFMSALSWVEDSGFMIEGLSGGNLPRPLGRRKESGLLICDAFDLSYLPEIADEKAALALALMREGRGLNHVGYAFLSFYRVLETAFPEDIKRIAWISTSIAGLTGFGVPSALEKIRAQGFTTPEAIGDHLYRSGRCAMAHATRQPIVDPDKPEDFRRLGSELPIVRAFAVKAIEDVFKVETRDTVYRNHLYELAGFREVLGPEIVRHMQNGGEPVDLQLDVPDISVRIRRREPYAPLEGLRCSGAGYVGKIIYMDFQSAEGDIQFRLALDFGAERMIFDPFIDVRVRDTGTAASADRIHEVRRFWHDHFCNGQLHIFDATTGELLGRKDAYMPLNMYFDNKGAAAELARWKALATERRDMDRRFAEQMECIARGYSVRLA